jgi:hypothetical protein
MLNIARNRATRILIRSLFRACRITLCGQKKASSRAAHAKLNCLPTLSVLKPLELLQTR